MSALAWMSKYCSAQTPPGARPVPPLRSIQRAPGSGQLVEEEINGGNPTAPSDDEIRSGVGWRIARAARYPWDPPTIANLLGLGNWLIAKVGMSRLDSACDAVDLVAATVDTLAGIVENDIFGVELVHRCASPLRVVFTEDVPKVPNKQGRNAGRHICLLL